MGDLFGGKTTTTSNQQADTGPSKFQSGYLQTAFDGAQANLTASQGTPAYQGQNYAGMTDAQKATLGNLKDYASGTGLDTASTLTGIGTQLAGNAGKATSALDQFSAAAGEDATASNIAAAGSYAANPYVDQMIDANSRDIGRTLNEQTLPGIDRAASGGGSINSSRAGVAQGIAQRGAADRVGDISAQIRGDAYSQGLTLAQGDRAQKLSALQGAASGYAGLASTGISAIGAGNSAAYDAYGAMTGADAKTQADAQGKLDADKKAWTEQDTRQSDLLKRYYDIIGQNSWGSSGTTSGSGTSSQNNGLLTNLMGAAATAAAFV